MPVCPWLDSTGTYASMSLVGLDLDLCQYVLGWTRLRLMPVCPWLDSTGTYASMCLVGLDWGSNPQSTTLVSSMLTLPVVSCLLVVTGLI